MRYFNSSHPQRPPAIRRAGFTLIELLVVIGILLLITAITASAINLTVNGDRVRGAARQVQSYLEGARSRAIYGGSPSSKGPGYQCGVRFIRDANNNTLVTSMQYVEVDPTNASITGGSYALARLDDDNDTVADSADVLRMVGAGGTNWYARAQQGLIYDYQFVLLDGKKYQIRTTRLSSTNEELLLTMPFSAAVLNASPAVVATPAGSTPVYKILLAPQPMANQEPRVLGNGVVLDLTLCKGLGYFTSSFQQIDVMFSPRGTVVGPLSGTGIVEFVLSDREDSVKGIQLPTTTTPVPTPKQARLIVSLTPQTGMTAVHPVYVDPAGVIADPYRYAETGEVARQ